MAARQGDFLLLNYTLKVKESGETVDTTFDNVAKDARIHREDAVYGPKFIILGEGSLPKGLEESLVGLEPGKTTTVEVPPDKGYGSRDPTKMRLVPFRRFREKTGGLDPIPGKEIEFDGKIAVVRAVGAGRVQVDFNHRLAGRTLVYDVSIEKVLEDEKEKIVNIISRRVPEVSTDKFTLQMQNNALTIEIPEEAFYLSGLQVAKKALTADLQRYFPEIDSISFIETFKKPSFKPEPSQLPPPTPTIQTKESEEASVKETEQKPEPERVRKAISPPPTKSTRRASRRRAMAGSENQR